MLRGIEVLQTLQQISGETSEEYFYQSARIKNGSLKKGIQLYSMAIHKFLGNSLIKRLENRSFQSNEDIRTRLIPETKAGSGEWVDLSELTAPQQEMLLLKQSSESSLPGKKLLSASTRCYMKIPAKNFLWQSVPDSVPMEIQSKKKLISNK